MNFTDDVLARLHLLAVAEPGSATLGALVAKHGAVETLARIREGAVGEQVSETWQRRLAAIDIDQIVATLEAASCDVLTPQSPQWPSQLNDLGSKAPLLLLTRGVLPLRVTALRSVAVVGARAASEYGNRQASVMSSELAEQGVAIVSGAAFGIDAAAHHGCLAADGNTIAVIASGIDVVYPSAHETLFASLLDHGVIVSEVLPGRRPTRAGFLARNRLIAALTNGTVVVEAALRSGALNTATWAHALQRHVMAVPGPVTSVTSAGCHRLIRDHEATLVCNAAEVLEQVGLLNAMNAPDVLQPGQVLDELAGPVATIYEALPARRAMSTQELVTTTGMAGDDVVTALGQLLLLGVVRHGEKGWSAVPGFRGTPGRRP